MVLKRILLFIVAFITILIALVYVSVSNSKKTFATCKILDIDDIEGIDFSKHDSVLVAANVLYKGNTIKNMVQGEQYRKVWSTPIKVPIAFLDTLRGGVKVVEEGGGQQTHSLEVKAENGIVYTLRSVSKNPEPLIPEFAKTLGLENIIVDGISAQHPYAALVVAELAENIGLLSTKPKLLFLPKQPDLGKYNQKFGNRLYLLEYETDGKADWTALSNATQVVDTEKLQELKMQHRKNLSIDENLVVRARLFDLLIGDWDRHAKQWGWVIQKKGPNLKAIPLPCDRDNAFFKIGGIVPTIISNKNILPDLQNFEKDIDYLPGLVMDFDVYFLHKTDRSVFLHEAKYLQNTLTDKAIADAFKIWPEQIFELNGEEIIEKIKERRKDLEKYASKFKDVLDEKSLLTEPLKGSKDVKLSNGLLGCFECLQ
ncbi:hypothetical protein [uncultured Kriegella sp.]|uniref:hypothetical protein n=1 Tax=uncultured Kriegella sp. TaxID=1798910 RepID=UPI0030DAF35D|tara:strand:- start:2902 stop:4182 length:1281 start_codon:yes stop_codon:yes gene_type:complete